MGYFNFFLILVTFIFFLSSSTAQLSSTVVLSPGVSPSWTNNDSSIPTTIRFTDGSVARFILLHQRELNTSSSSSTSTTTSQVGFGFGYGFCFYCTHQAGEAPCYLAVVFVEMANGIILTKPTKVVWSANRDNPVGQNATLVFSASQSLVLYNTESSTTSPVWSANTTSVSVSAMSVTEKGNLVIYDREGGGIVWQSFDHITDTLLDGQMLARGQGLTSSVSPSNMSTGLFNAGIDKSSLSAFSEVDYFPIRYLSLNFSFINLPLNYVEFTKGNITFDYYYLMKWPRSYRASLLTSNKSSVQIMKMDYDGGLRIYGWEPGKGWENLYALAEWSNECRFPLRCGRYGVCNEGGNCTCPAAMDGVRYFTSGFVGCSQVLVEGTHDHYRLVNFGNLSYYGSFDKNQARPGVEDEVSCVEACEKITSCQAAFFNFEKLYSKGYCFLAESVLTLMNTTESDNQYSSSYIKIQISSHKNSSTTSVGLNSPFLDLALLASFAVLLSMTMITIVVILVFQKKKTEEWTDHAFLKQVSTEIPIKSFSYHELYVATEKFSEELGQGGFGTVFRGVLKDGTVVAVKRLETMRGTKEFLAEVESIGNIHHINLVRLIGFCANRKYRMLVYEYMSKGSLDKWIFCKPDAALDWNTRKKIVIDIAKGLAYLHEECRHRIAHLDVKPHNVLLDDNFNAKLSDFGMSKMINRDESRVVTGIRGTLGYLAPEWEDLGITVKADVYSFGILLLEIITGKKILDYSRPHSDVHLLSLLGKKASENRLKDMVECQSEDMQHHVEEAIGMMRLGMWCSDGDYNRRPSMSMVVKILDSGINARFNSTTIEKLVESFLLVQLFVF